MPTIDQAIDEFLSLKRIAVAGVSRDANGTHASNGIYTRFKERGYEVFPVNPNTDEIMGDPCYRSLKDIPGGVSLSVAQECNELGVDKVWVHKNFGAGSYSREAHDYSRDHGITALVSCPLWYGQTADGFHKFLGATCRVLRQVPNTLD